MTLDGEGLVARVSRSSTFRAVLSSPGVFAFIFFEMTPSVNGAFFKKVCDWLAARCGGVSVPPENSSCD